MNFTLSASMQEGRVNAAPPPQRKFYPRGLIFDPRRLRPTSEYHPQTEHFVRCFNISRSMKTVIVSGVVLVLFTLDALAQPAGFGSDGRTEDGYSITERGPHHRIWERREIETTLMGTQVERKRSYTELETGMHYWEDNQWKEAVEEIEIVGDHALATKGAHKVIFKANFVDVGVVDLLTPDEQRFRSHILGLSYFDSATGQAVLIAEPSF